jgi:hypothetical protein
MKDCLRWRRHWGKGKPKWGLWPWDFEPTSWRSLENECIDGAREDDLRNGREERVWEENMMKDCEELVRTSQICVTHTIKEEY